MHTTHTTEQTETKSFDFLSINPPDTWQKYNNANSFFDTIIASMRATIDGDLDDANELYADAYALMEQDADPDEDEQDRILNGTNSFISQDIRDKYNTYQVTATRQAAKDANRLAEDQQWVSQDVIKRINANRKTYKMWVPQGLKTHLEHAWQSKEWADNLFVKSRQNKSNFEKIYCLLAYLHNVSTTNDSHVFYRTIYFFFNKNLEYVEAFIELLTLPWTSEHGKHVSQLATSYSRDRHSKKTGQGKITWSDFPFSHRKNTKEFNDKDHKILISKLNERTRENFSNALCDKILKKEMENFSEIEIYDWEYIENSIDWEKLIDQKPLKKKSKKFMAETLADKIQEKKEYYQGSYTYWSEQAPFYSKNHDRHYTPYIMVPSAVRKLFTWQGKSLAWLDVASMHPTILFSDFLTICLESRENQIISEIINNENPRKKLFEILNSNLSKKEKKIDWDKFKKGFLTFLNAKNLTSKKSVIGQRIKTLLPNFANFLERIKYSLGHKSVSRYLLAKEADIMEAILTKSWEKGIFCLGAHDGIDCDPDRVNEVRDIFRQVMWVNKMPCNISDK